MLSRFTAVLIAALLAIPALPEAGAANEKRLRRKINNSIVRSKKYEDAKNKLQEACALPPGFKDRARATRDNLTKVSSTLKKPYDRALTAMDRSLNQCGKATIAKCSAQVSQRALKRPGKSIKKLKKNPLHFGDKVAGCIYNTAAKIQRTRTQVRNMMRAAAKDAAIKALEKAGGKNAVKKLNKKSKNIVDRKNKLKDSIKDKKAELKKRKEAAAAKRKAAQAAKLKKQEARRKAAEAAKRKAAEAKRKAAEAAKRKAAEAKRKAAEAKRKAAEAKRKAAAAAKRKAAEAKKKAKKAAKKATNKVNKALGGNKKKKKKKK